MVTIVGTLGSVGMVFRSLCQFQQMDIIHIMGGRHVWPTSTLVWSAYWRVTSEKFGTRTTVRARLSVFVRRSGFTNWKSGTIRVDVKTILKSV